ncbi:MAG TPA: type II toxin-antitoxin system prevent-host-death family antitoxin [Thermoanaerobaculia bacterium]|nr:type II toxin-antitoxin system prevent-host-death family antitoxin [Thermoanaerobaculia bacterium]
MIHAGVRSVKDHLSEYLRRVRQGQRVVITDRGRPVAALVGIDEEDASETAWRLVRQGLGEWGGGKPRGLPNPPRIRGRRAEEVVLEDRR